MNFLCFALFLVELIYCDSNITCKNGAAFNLSSYLYFSNNEWGRNNADNGYWQCIQLIGDNNDEYKIEYYWNTNNHSSIYSVKSFPMIVSGWNPGVGYMFGIGAGNIPFRVDSNSKVITTWNTYHINENISMIELYDVAFDIWLGHNNEILNASSSPSTEIMIWLSYTKNTEPIGQIIANPSFWGIDFVLYGGVGTGHTFVTYSFLYKNKTNTDYNHLWNINNVNLNDIFIYLMNNKYINGSQYICGILAGIEIRQGRGDFVYTNYSLNISK